MKCANRANNPSTVHASGRTGPPDSASDSKRGLCVEIWPQMFRAAQMPHLQTLWACWMPLGLYALHRFVGEKRRRHLVLFAVCWLMSPLVIAVSMSEAAGS